MWGRVHKLEEGRPEETPWSFPHASGCGPSQQLHTWLLRASGAPGVVQGGPETLPWFAGVTQRCHRHHRGRAGRKRGMLILHRGPERLRVMQGPQEGESQGLGVKCEATTETGEGRRVADCSLSPGRPSAQRRSTGPRWMGDWKPSCHYWILP